MCHRVEFLCKEEQLHYIQYIHSEQVAHYKGHNLYNRKCLQILSLCNKDLGEEISFYIESLSLLESATLSCVCKNFSSKWIKSIHRLCTNSISNDVNVIGCIERISTSRILINYCACCKGVTLWYVHIIKYSTTCTYIYWTITQFYIYHISSGSCCGG